MPRRPCTAESGAATDSASAPVHGHGHPFGRGVDQPDYASPPFRLVLVVLSFHASVTGRAVSYGPDPQLVSIRLGGRSPPKPIRARSSSRRCPRLQPLQHLGRSDPEVPDGLSPESLGRCRAHRHGETLTLLDICSTTTSRGDRPVF